jgi:arginase
VTRAVSTTFVVVPEWQASGSARAMRLVDGAEAIRGDLPSASTVTVDVPAGAGDPLGTGIPRASAIVTVRERLQHALETSSGTPVLIGGDCGAELGAVEHALRRHPDAAVVWFDAHCDLNTPESSPSGVFNGMVVRALLGDLPEPLRPAQTLQPTRLIYVGARSIDPGEETYLAEHGVPVLGADPDALVEAVAATGAGSVYVHVDLDVLDPSEFTGLDMPEPFGLTGAEVVAAIRALRQRFPLAGAGVTEFSPASPVAAVDDLPTILRIVGALAAA